MSLSLALRIALELVRRHRVTLESIEAFGFDCSAVEPEHDCLLLLLDSVAVAGWADCSLSSAEHQIHCVDAAAVLVEDFGIAKAEADRVEAQLM